MCANQVVCYCMAAIGSHSTTYYIGGYDWREIDIGTDHDQERHKKLT